MRLFVALPLPDQIKQVLEGVCCGLPGARWLDPDDWHITLRFLGEQPEECLPNLIMALDEVPVPRFSFRAHGVGVFHRHRRPAVLWAGIDPEDEVCRLEKSISQALRSLNLGDQAMRRQRFKPHITLARLKGSSSERVGRFLMGNNLLSCPLADIDGFALMRSCLHPQGAEYESLHFFDAH